MDVTVKERYERMAQECAAKACESLDAWSRHGFAAGFFLALRLRGPIRLPSSSLLATCLRSVPSSPEEAEARLAFTQALMREAMAMQSALAERRGRLVSAGMAAAATAAILLMALVAYAAALGMELSAAGTFLGGYLAWTAGSLRAESREAELFAATGRTGDPSLFVPWEDGFAGKFRKMAGTAPADVPLGYGRL
mgnify:CR=1 FL=1